MEKIKFIKDLIEDWRTSAKQCRSADREAEADIYDECAAMMAARFPVSSARCEVCKEREGKKYHIPGAKGPKDYMCICDVCDKGIKVAIRLRRKRKERAKSNLIEGTWPENDIRRAFVAGAKWWEFHKTEFTMWNSDRRLAEKEAEKRYESRTNGPKVVVLCGSSKFVEIMVVCAWLLERDEKAITMGLHLLPWWYATKEEIPDHLAEHEGCADEMDALHLRKIDLADEIFVVNFQDYIGDSTTKEIKYAMSIGKKIRWFRQDWIGQKVINIMP